MSTSLISKSNLNPTYVAAISVVLASGMIYRYTWPKKKSQLADLPTPPNPHWFWGHLPKVIDTTNNQRIAEEWAETYGDNIAVDGLIFTQKKLWTLDPKTIGYVLSKASLYPKPEDSIIALEQITGNGLLVVEGDAHKRQRKVLNPAFSPARIREFVPIFFEKSKLMVTRWTEIISENGGQESTVDVLNWMGRATLDVIGEAGFGYHFNALVDESNELAAAIAEMFRSLTSFTIFGILQRFFPIMRNFPTRRNRSIKLNRDIIHRIGNDLVSEKKEEILKSSEGTKDDLVRDMLSMLVKSNIASHDLSQEEVLAQITTFVLAGHETTSTALTGFLHAMSTHPEIQSKLRQEVLAVSTTTPSIEELNSLPYLDKVLRETLRLHSPATITNRVATQEDVLPVSEPFIDKNGQKCHEIRVQEGDVIFIPILSLNASPKLWGPDAKDFKPERWDAPPGAISAIPSVYSNMITFLSGPRACIGWRMAILEMKVFMFTMIRNFEFKIDPALQIRKKTVIVSRPYVVGQEEKRNQLPLIISRYQSGDE